MINAKTIKNEYPNYRFNRFVISFYDCEENEGLSDRTYKTAGRAYKACNRLIAEGHWLQLDAYGFDPEGRFTIVNLGSC